MRGKQSPSGVKTTTIVASYRSSTGVARVSECRGCENFINPEYPIGATLHGCPAGSIITGFPTFPLASLLDRLSETMDLARLRNIGISAHIDSGKTTLSERILFYAGRIHRMQEVHGERRRRHHGPHGAGEGTRHHHHQRRHPGRLGRATINLIDTPGHVDFTVEVERSLRVLDGAILVLCAVGGVQAQSLTIDRQMRRYHVPRLAFINKMDRTGADPDKVVEQLRAKLGCDAVLMQLPIGREADFQGVVDLVAAEGVSTSTAPTAKTSAREPIPAEMADEARRRPAAPARSAVDVQRRVDGAAAGRGRAVPLALIHDVIRSAVAQLEFTPVFLGSAYRNKGVQPLLDAVVRYCLRRWTAATKALAQATGEGQCTRFGCARSRTSRPWPWPSRSSKTPTAR